VARETLSAHKVLVDDGTGSEPARCTQQHYKACNKGHYKPEVL
jgi:hypothetical protein